MPNSKVIGKMCLLVPGKVIEVKGPVAGVKREVRLDLLPDIKPGDGLENFKIYSVHRLTPPAVEVLLKQGKVFHGLIDPGHVSTIIRVKG